MELIFVSKWSRRSASDLLYSLHGDLLSRPKLANKSGRSVKVNILPDSSAAKKDTQSCAREKTEREREIAQGVLRANTFAGSDTLCNKSSF